MECVGLFSFLSVPLTRLGPEVGGHWHASLPDPGAWSRWANMSTNCLVSEDWSHSLSTKRTCVLSLVSLSMDLFLLLNNFQQHRHLKYTFQSSVPMGSHLNAKFMVAYTKKKVVSDHLLFSEAVHKGPHHISQLLKSLYIRVDILELAPSSQDWAMYVAVKSVAESVPLARRAFTSSCIRGWNGEHLTYANTVPLRWATGLLLIPWRAWAIFPGAQPTEQPRRDPDGR